MILEHLFSESQYARPEAEKEKVLLPELIALTKHHLKNCPAYERIVRLTAPDFENAKSLDALPYIPTGLFKTHKLQSVPDKDIRLTLTSSGTTGQGVSQIVVDDITAKYQAHALSAVMREAFGTKRLPMLIIDSEETLRNRDQLNARAAGVLGMMVYGQNPVFALDAQMRLNETAVGDFLEKHGHQPFLIFGFTYMVWRNLYQPLQKKRWDLSQAILIHSGGWKKLENEAVDNAQFRRSLQERCGLTRIYNFYGMAEQLGTAFLEGEEGNLYPPAFGDVIIRDPETWQALPPGKEGIIQVLSLVPHSYPGHSILTEDLGVITAIDKGSRKGKAIKVLGRIPKAELRGCSDVYAAGIL